MDDARANLYAALAIAAYFVFVMLYCAWACGLFE